MFSYSAKKFSMYCKVIGVSGGGDYLLCSGIYLLCAICRFWVTSLELGTSVVFITPLELGMGNGDVIEF